LGSHDSRCWHSSRNDLTEIKCPAREGTGLAKVTQPVQPGAKYIHRPVRNALARDGLKRLLGPETRGKTLTADLEVIEGVAQPAT
jgi:hypothetical protein